METTHEQRMKKIDDWFNSEEGKRSIEEVIESIKEEEDLAQKLENKSTLCYTDGQKVMRGDVFVEEFEANKEYFYVHRINEDETIDACLGCNIALKMNNVNFFSNESTLIQRNGTLYSPLDEAFDTLESLDE